MLTGISEQIISYLPSKSLLYQTVIFFKDSRRLESCKIALVTFLIRYHYWRTFIAYGRSWLFVYFFFLRDCSQISTIRQNSQLFPPCQEIPHIITSVSCGVTRVKMFKNIYISSPYFFDFEFWSKGTATTFMSRTTAISMTCIQTHTDRHGSHCTI